MVAAIAATAFAGGGSASADSLCSVDPAGGASGECPAASVYKGSIVLLANEAVFTASGLSTKCKSEALADWIENEGPHKGLRLQALQVTLTECTGACLAAKSENLPWSALVSALKAHVIIIGEKGGNPSFLRECNLFGFPVNCLYEVSEALASYELGELGKKGPAFKAAVPLTRGGDSALCPATGELSGLYFVYKDLGGGPPAKEGESLYLAALP
jgi:hypothetical protein